MEVDAGFGCATECDLPQTCEEHKVAKYKYSDELILQHFHQNNAQTLGLSTGDVCEQHSMLVHV